MGPPELPGFTVRTDIRNGVARLALVGELDTHFVPHLKVHLDRFVGGGGISAAMLDLRELTFMESSGLQLLLRAAADARQNGHRLAIVGVGGMPRRLLELTETERVLIDETDGIELIQRFASAEPEADGSFGSAEGGDLDG